MCKAPHTLKDSEGDLLTIRGVQCMTTTSFRIQVHDQGTLVNTATRQKALFEVLDLFGYKGHYVVYGERLRQGIWLPSTIGHTQAPPGPACFPLFLPPASQVVALVDVLRSLPLYLEIGGIQIPLLSLEDAYKMLGGTRYGKDAMITRAQQLIDLYLEWEPTHTLPTWFALKRDLVQGRN